MISINCSILAFDAQMSTTQLLIRLPDELARRFKRNISPRHRSKFIQRLLEEALPPEDGGDDDPLYRAALDVEKEDAATLSKTTIGESDGAAGRPDCGSAW